MGTELYTWSTQLRARAMESQLSAAFTLCSTANIAVVLGRVQNAREAIGNARRTAEVVRLHLAEPSHVPADAIQSIADRLAKLDSLISSLEVPSRGNC
jgi:hypothetical protein